MSAEQSLLADYKDFETVGDGLMVSSSATLRASARAVGWRSGDAESEATCLQVEHDRHPDRDRSWRGPASACNPFARHSRVESAGIRRGSSHNQPGAVVVHGFGASGFGSSSMTTSLFSRSWAATGCRARSPRRMRSCPLRLRSATSSQEPEALSASHACRDFSSPRVRALAAGAAPPGRRRLSCRRRRRSNAPTRPTACREARDAQDEIVVASSLTLRAGTRHCGWALVRRRRHACRGRHERGRRRHGRRRCGRRRRRCGPRVRSRRGLRRRRVGRTTWFRH